MTSAGATIGGIELFGLISITLVISSVSRQFDRIENVIFNHVFDLIT